MADEHQHIDIKPHEQTYHSLIGLLKYGSVAVFILAFVVIWLISHK